MARVWRSATSAEQLAARAVNCQDRAIAWKREAGTLGLRVLLTQGAGGQQAGQVLSPLSSWSIPTRRERARLKGAFYF